MRPKRIILIRHGRSKTTVEARIVGRKIAELVGDGAFGGYVSPYLRTMQTQEFIHCCPVNLLIVTHSVAMRRLFVAQVSLDG